MMTDRVIDLWRSRRRLLWAILAAGGMGFVFSLYLAHTPQDARDAAAPSLEPQPFALLQLFRAESCRDCSLAETVLSELATDYAKRRQRVYGLVFVARQWAQPRPQGDSGLDAHALQLHKNYLARAAVAAQGGPALFLNGTRGLPPLERGAAYRGVELALAEPATIGLDLHWRGAPDKAGQYQLAYLLSQAAPGLVLNIALVDRSGRDQSAGNLYRVRRLQSHALDKRRDGSIDIQIDADIGRPILVGLLQDPNTADIVAMAMLTRKPG